MEKTCTSCSQTKPATAEFFFRQKKGKYGFRATCKQCKYGAEREYMKRYFAEYYKENKEKLLSEAKRRAPRYADKRAEYTRRYYDRHRPRILEQQRRWRAENPDLWREIVKEYERRNPDVRRLIKSNRRAREKGLTETATLRHIERLRVAQKGRCWWCQCTLTNYHLDHRIPLKLGGDSSPGNLVLACPPCNLRKASKMPWQIDNPRLL